MFQGDGEKQGTIATQSSGNQALGRLIWDIVLTEVALFAAGKVVGLFPQPGVSGEQRAAFPPLVYLVVALLWATAFLLASLYESGSRRGREVQTVVGTVTLATLALGGTLFFFFPQVPRQPVRIFYWLDLGLLIGSRLAVMGALKLHGRDRTPARKVLIVGGGEEGRNVGRVIVANAAAGFELVGYLDDTLELEGTIDGYPVLGKMEELACQVQARDVDEVIVAIPLGAYERFFRLVGQLPPVPAQVRLVPSHFKLALFRPRIEEIAGVPTITIQKPALTDFERRIKRIFDLVVAGLSLIVISPLLAAVAIAIRLDSPGPILFKQQRVGENGQLFWMYKFRSMVQGAEAQEQERIYAAGDGSLRFKEPDDPRVTRVGRFLRRTSIDEFPQILNVFRGEMSLVGPRPELPWLTEEYEPWQWQRVSVPQGITGWWQVNGRSDKPMHLHTEEDLVYIQNYSFLLDILILWRTVGAVIRGKGAF